MSLVKLNNDRNDLQNERAKILKSKTEDMKEVATKYKKGTTEYIREMKKINEKYRGVS